MNTYTPRHLRRKGNSSRNGTVDRTKSQAFRAAAQYSKRFIHQSASTLLGPLNQEYVKYCGVVDRNALRKGS